MRRLVLLGLLGLALSLLPQPAGAAIVFSHASNFTPASNATTSGNVAVTINSGDTVVVAIQLDNTRTVSTVVDDKSGGSNTYTAQCRTTTGVYSVDLFTATAAGSAANITVTPSGNSDIGVAVATYTGVSSIGACSAGSTATSTAPSDTITLTQTTDFGVTGFWGKDNQAFTVTTGNGRANNFCNCSFDRMNSSIFDNTGASSVTNTAAASISALWLAISIDLVGPAAGGAGAAVTPTPTPGTATIRLGRSLR